MPADTAAAKHSCSCCCRRRRGCCMGSWHGSASGPWHVSKGTTTWRACFWSRATAYPWDKTLRFLLLTIYSRSWQWR